MDSPTSAKHKEVNRVQPRRPSCSPPRPNPNEISLPLIALWEKIPGGEQSHVHRVFGNILLRKLHAPPANKEVTYGLVYQDELRH